MPSPIIDRNAFVARHAEARVREALADTRIVAIVGPRQSGKTTLARHVAAAEGRTFITLDDDQYRRFAESDPIGFMRGHRSLVIDEIQRAPGLILALKQAVDEDSRAADPRAADPRAGDPRARDPQAADPQPGRFLITASVDLFRGSISPDSLAGRVETVELLPFSQAEIAGAGPPRFLERAFAGDFPALAITGATDDLIDRVLAGGYAPALSRPSPVRRAAWLRAYARSLVERDVSDIATVDKHDEMTRLIEHAAVSAGQLLNMSSLGSHLGVDSKTVDRWLVLLEHMFVVRRIRAWHRSELGRLVKTPKLQFLDSGLLAALRRMGHKDIASHRQNLRPLLVCFVHAEIAKAAALCEEPTAIAHYRDKDKIEVGMVLERAGGATVGIEVEAGATARPDQFRGLVRLRDAVGYRFVCGILLHDGERVQRAGPGMFAMPVKMLWEA